MADNTDLLQQINNYGRANNVPIILDASLPLLCSKIREQGAKRILEIGTAIGYSAIAMASECQVEHITTLELDPKRFAIADADTERPHHDFQLQIAQCFHSFILLQSNLPSAESCHRWWIPAPPPGFQGWA